MTTYETTLTTGISRTKEFERKGLASFAINVSTKCGHGCCRALPTLLTTSTNWCDSP